MSLILVVLFRVVGGEAGWPQHPLVVADAHVTHDSEVNGQADQVIEALESERCRELGARQGMAERGRSLHDAPEA